MAGAPGRTIVVGDVHGCLRELDALLEKIAFSPADRLVFVGDLVARGPDSAGVVRRARELSAVVVRGNHEQKLLDARSGQRDKPLGKVHKAVFDALGDDGWDTLSRSVLFHELPEHDAVVVHAGVDPRVGVRGTLPEHLLAMRTLDADGEPSSEFDGPLWATAWNGPTHVVFGHNASREPQSHAHATGLDTGCVYGGKLTALVLAKGAPVPPRASIRAALVSVPAEKQHYGYTLPVVPRGWPVPP